MKNFYKNVNIVPIILILFLCVDIAAGYGGSSSGGSRGMSTSNVDPFSNIIKYEIRYNDFVVNKTVEYTFTTPEFGIYQVLINGKENEYDISVRIEDLRNKSKYAKKQAPGLIYKNETVLIGNKRINYIAIRYKVNNSWIKDNNLSNAQYPRLLKWNGTTWLVLKTNIIGKDNNYTYFEASKAGSVFLSIFAISAPPKMSNQTIASQGTIQKQEDNKDVAPEIIEEIEEKKLPGFDSTTFIISMMLLSVYVKRKTIKR